MEVTGKEVNVLFLDGYLLVLPGDYSGHLFAAEGSDYQFVCNIPFWDDGRKGPSVYMPSYFGIIHDHLVGLNYHSLYFFDLNAPEKYRLRKNVSTSDKSWISSSGRLAQLVSWMNADSSYGISFPTGPKMMMKSPLLTIDQTEKLAQSHRAEAHRLDFNGKKASVRHRQSFGSYRHDQGAHDAWPLFWVSQLTQRNDTIIQSSLSSHWIQLYNRDGVLLDSINATAQSATEPFVQPIKQLDREGISETWDISGYYGSLISLDEEDLMVRQYWLKKGPDGERRTFLQAIDWKSKEVREIELQAGDMIKTGDQGYLIKVEAVDSPKGYLRLGRFRLDWAK